MNTIEKDLERRQEEYKRYNEKEFKKNKININVRLNGDNKYYHAFQCALFTENLLKYGYDNITKEEIKNNGISFDKYCINLGYNKYCRDLKRFSSKQEMIGFVIGYNEAISHINA